MGIDVDKTKLKFRKSNREEFEFNDSIKFELRNYIDKSIYQTMMDSKKHDNEQFRLIEQPLFKADKNEKDVDEIIVSYSTIIPAIHKILGNQ